MRVEKGWPGVRGRFYQESRLLTQRSLKTSEKIDSRSPMVSPNWNVGDHGGIVFFGWVTPEAGKRAAIGTWWAAIAGVVAVLESAGR